MSNIKFRHVNDTGHPGMAIVMGTVARPDGGKPWVVARSYKRHTDFLLDKEPSLDDPNGREAERAVRLDLQNLVYSERIDAARLENYNAALREAYWSGVCKGQTTKACNLFAAFREEFLPSKAHGRAIELLREAEGFK